MKIEDLSQLGAIIKERRQLASLTLDQASELLGVGRRFLIELEKGSRRANVETVIHVLRMYGLNLEVTGGINPQISYESTTPRRPLRVMMGRTEVGVLRFEDGGLEFDYRDEVLEDDSIPPVSFGLPKQASSFKGTACSFFENLLPEGFQREVLAAEIGTIDTDVFSALEFAADCAGAVALLPEGETPDAPGYRSLSDRKLEKLVKKSRGSFASVQIAARAFLAGTRPKIPVMRKSDGWLLAEGGSPSTHFLKGPAGNLANLDIVENEFFCMKLAGAAGLPVADVEYLRLPGPVLLVERFDRETGPTGELRKVHQEDFCQATGRTSHAKTEAAGGPSYSEMGKAISAVSSLPVRDMMLFARWIVFNYLIGNANAHAKNISILYDHRGTRLAPCYGLLSTAALPKEKGAKPTMKLAGEYRDGRITKPVWAKVGDELDLPEKAILRALEDVTEAVTEVLDGTLLAVCEICGENPVFDRIADVINSRATPSGA